MVEEKVLKEKSKDLNILESFLNDLNEKEKEHLLNLLNYKETYVNIPLKGANGDFKNITGVKVDNFLVYNDTFSNLRIHPYFDIDYFKRFSLLNTIMFSLFEIPVNGSFSSILVDPFDLSIEEKEELFKMFSSLLKNEIPEKNYFFSSDLNSNLNDLKIFCESFHYEDKDRKRMISFVDQYSDIKKEIDVERINEISTYYSIKKFCEIKRKNFDELSVVVYGFGEKPCYLSKMLRKEGFNIVGILTHQGSFYDPYGIEIDEFYKNYLSSSPDKNETRYKKIDLYTFENIRSDITIFYIDLFKKDFLTNINTSLVVEGRRMIFTDEDFLMMKNKGVECLPCEFTCSGEILLYDELRKNRIPKKVETMIQKEIYHKIDQIFAFEGEDVKSKIIKIALRNILENF
ncbi:MAG: Glu/Leu/Phe/Val dehydrogenase dimerization domain-containing protein [candidate division WOR-3 bacterium]